MDLSGIGTSEAQFRGELLEAALKGNGPQVKKLVSDYSLQHDTSPCKILSQTTDAEGRTALHFACYSNSDTNSDEQQEDIVSLLLDWLASLDDKTAVFQLLNQQDKEGITPLILAARNPTGTLSEQRIHALLDSPIGGDKLALTQSKAGATALHYASDATHTTQATLLRLFEAAPVALETNSCKGGTPLHWACTVTPPTIHSLQTLSTLVETCGAHVNAKNEQGLTPLIMAAAARNDAHCKYLIQHGADISIVLPGNINIFHMCADLGLIGTLEELLKTQHQETIDKYCQAKTDTNETPLDVALHEGNVAIVKLLSGESNEEAVKEMILQANKKRALDAGKDEKNTSSANKLPMASSRQGNSSDEQEEEQVAEILAKIHEMTISDHAVEQSLSLKQQGNSHFAKREWLQALDCYSKAIELNPADATFYSNRSACYMELGEPEKALQDALVARHLKPTWTKACYRMAVARMALELYEDAAVAAFEGLQQDEDNEELKLLLRRAVAKGKKQHQAKLKASSGGSSSSP